MSNLTLTEQEQRLIPQFQRVMNGDESRATSFVAQMLLSLKRLPDVQQKIYTDEDEKASYMSQMIMVATAGLSPDNTQNQTATALIKGKVSVIIMYQGYILIARQNGIGVNAQIVYENDKFSHDVANGVISHEICLTGDRGKIVCYYAVAKDLKTGRILRIRLMTQNEGLAYREKWDKSKSDYSAWKTNFKEMCLKTVVRNACTQSGLCFNKAVTELESIGSTLQSEEIPVLQPENEPLPEPLPTKVEVIEAPAPAPVAKAKAPVPEPTPEPAKQPSQPAPAPAEEDFL